MVSLKLQKRLAASVLKCGRGKVWLDPNEVNEISMANSRTLSLTLSRLDSILLFRAVDCSISLHVVASRSLVSISQSEVCLLSLRFLDVTYVLGSEKFSLGYVWNPRSFMRLMLVIILFCSHRREQLKLELIAYHYINSWFSYRGESRNYLILQLC